jgi:hypothetical protein
MGLIHRKLASIASSIAAVPKHSTNKDDGYKFRSIYDMYNGLEPLFKREGVFLTPNILESSETTVNTNKGRAFRVKLKVEWTFYCEDGSTITAITLGEGIDSSDKASNKAMTASLKYLLIYTFLIPTVPYDPDADFNSPTIEPFESEPKPTPKSGPVPKSLLALVEMKGLSREDLMNIGTKLGMDPKVELTAEDRKKLYDFILPKSKEELLL